MPAERPPAERTLAETLRRRAVDAPDALAFLFLLSDGAEGPRLSYAELDAQARAVAAAVGRVAGPGERALLVFAPGLEFLPAFFGCLYAGVIAVPAYPPRPDRPWDGVAALARLAEDCTPRVVLVGGEAAADVERLCRGDASLAALRWLNADDVPAASAGSRAAEDPAGISHLQYTSGTTAAPKGVAIGHAELMHNERMIASAPGHVETAAAGICGVSWLPAQHDLGLVGGLLQAVYVGGPLVLLSPLTMLQRPFLWLEAISRYRAHTSAGPNFAYDLCVRRLSPEQRAALDLSCWKVAGIGAEPIRPASLNGFAEAFAGSGFRPEAFYPSYGLAEGTLMVAGGEKDAAPILRGFSADALARGEAVPAEGDAARTLVGCGRAWLGQQVLAVDPETAAPCPPGRVGEIWVAGPSVARGYWNRPEETERTFRGRLADGDGLAEGDGPFLRTGDLGVFVDGELFVTGRLKDLLIVRGQNHYPQDVEATVQAADPAFRGDAGAAFQTDRDGTERLVLVQEIARAGRRAEPDALVRAARRAVAERHGVELDEVVLVRNGTLPKTTSGKVRRFACKAAYDAGRLVLWQPKDAAGGPSE